MHYTEYCKAQGIHQDTPLALYDFHQGLKQISMDYPSVLAEIERMTPRRLSNLYEVMQRCLDILLGFVGILINAIPFLVIAIAIKIDSPGPVLYRQKRVGKGGKVFQMIKFRTMRQDAEHTTGPVWAAKHDPRVTRVGVFLRRMRLDEMPQLLNILKGDMTFVGPRPERPEFVYLFTEHIPAFDRRHDVKPGIAGIAQLMNGYDSSTKSIYRKLRWDAQYMQKKCMKTDIDILLRTIVAVLRGTI